MNLDDCPDIFVFLCCKYREVELSAAHFIYLRQPRITTAPSCSFDTAEKRSAAFQIIDPVEYFQTEVSSSPAPASGRRHQHQGQGPDRGLRHRRPLHRVRGRRQVRGLQQAPRLQEVLRPRQPQ